MKAKLRGPALSVSIRHHIKDYIIKNNLQAGDPLPSEGQLATELVCIFRFVLLDQIRIES